MTDFNINGSKPKLLYFQYAYDSKLPPFLLIHAHEQLSCLKHFFQVTVIHHDCDYEEVCELHRPDVVLVELGVNHATCRRPKVRNKRSFSHIPKAGLHHADAFCNARAGLLCDMEDWGIDTVFAISTTAGDHTEDLVDKLYYWPVFVDALVYRDYLLPKSINILATGNASAMYPWRQRVIPRLAHHFPTLTCPHPGYSPVGRFNSVLFGESYARLLNAAWFVPACGTVAGEAVRKHFEIPACMSCLVTQRTPALEAAGFEDLVNCVFADENDVVEKLELLYGDLEKLSALVQRGHELVKSRHTLTSRGQIFEWYRLRMRMLSNERIVQPNPFEMPMLVQAESSLYTYHVRSNGEHLQWLRAGNQLLAANDVAGAEAAYVSCINSMAWMPEPQLGRAMCSLFQGFPIAAWRRLSELIRFELDDYEAAEPDPVEWAYVIVTMLCLGAISTATRLAHRFSEMHHPELDMARWLCNGLSGQVQACPTFNAADRRPSVHRVMYRTREAWMNAVAEMLMKCGQKTTAQWLQTQCRRGDLADVRTSIRKTLSNEARAAALQFMTWTHARSIIVSRALHLAAWRRSASFACRGKISRVRQFMRGPRPFAGCHDLMVTMDGWLGNWEASCEVIGALPGSEITTALLLDTRPHWVAHLTLMQLLPSFNRAPSGPRETRWVRIKREGWPTEVRRDVVRSSPSGHARVVIIDSAGLSARSDSVKTVVDHVSHADAVVLLGTDRTLDFSIEHELLLSSGFRLAASAGQPACWAILLAGRHYTADTGDETVIREKCRRVSSSRHKESLRFKDERKAPLLYRIWPPFIKRTTNYVWVKYARQRSLSRPSGGIDLMYSKYTGGCSAPSRSV